MCSLGLYRNILHNVFAVGHNSFELDIVNFEARIQYVNERAVIEKCQDSCR